MAEGLLGPLGGFDPTALWDPRLMLALRGASESRATSLDRRAEDPSHLGARRRRRSHSAPRSPGAAEASGPH